MAKCFCYTAMILGQHAGLSEEARLFAGTGWPSLSVNQRVLSSVQSLDRLGRWGDMRDFLAEILSQSFLDEAPVSSSGMGRVVSSSMLSI